MRRLIALTFALAGLLVLYGGSLYAQSTSCPGAPEPRLTIGENARVAQTVVTIRDDIAGAPIRTVEATDNAVFNVLAGPYCYGVYNWWEVSAGQVSGWVAEGTGLIYWLEPVSEDSEREFGTGGVINTDAPTDENIVAEGIPAGTGPGIPTLPAKAEELSADCKGAPPARLEVGLPGRVAQSYSNIREEIGSSTVLDTLYRFTGDTFIVVDGPVCAGPHYWWQIEFEGVTGWATEGSAYDYWLVPALEG